MKTRASMIGLVIGVALLTGCTGAPAPTPASTPDTIETSAPPVDPGPGPRPEAQVPLSCDEAIPADTPLPYFGGELELSSSESDAFAAAWAAQAGRLDCHWWGAEHGEGYRSGSLRITVERDGAAIAAASDVPLDGTFGTPQSRLACDMTTHFAGQRDYPCWGAVLVGDSLVSFVADFPAPLVWDPSEVMHVLVDPTIDLLGSRPVAPRWERDAADWPAIIECDAIDAGWDPGAVIGVTMSELRDATLGDGAVSRDVAARSGLSACTWWAGTSPGAVVQIRLLAGSGWLLSEPSTGGARSIEPVEVPGADDAALECDEWMCRLLMRIDRNAVEVGGEREGEAGHSFLTRDELLALGGALAPVLEELAP